MKIRNLSAIVSAVVILAMPTATWAGQFLIDLSDLDGSEDGWDVVTGDVEEEPLNDWSGGGDDDVTLTITGFLNENNPNPPGESAVIDGVDVPLEALGDYVWGADGPGSTALFEFQNLDAGTYNVSVFEGRTTDSNGQFGKIWVGTLEDEPGDENTGDFAGASSTLTGLTVGAGDSLFYLHQEDDIGGTGGLIVQTQGTDPMISTLNPADDEGGVAVGTNFVVTFDRAIAAGAGDIAIKNLTDGTEIAIPAEDAQVSTADTVLTIDPAASLEEGKDYAIRIDATAIEDTTGTAFAGILEDTTWNFRTIVPVEPGRDDLILVDFAGEEANSSGSAPEPWVTIDILEEDEEVDLGNGVTLTALDDGFTPNNPAPPGEEVEYDGVLVPVEALDDYLFKTDDAAGTEARLRIDGLRAGTYNITVFEGRLSDSEQFAKIWVGEEPDDENTGNFAGDSATVEVVVGAGDVLWYKHLEDNVGGLSGLIIRRTSVSQPLEVVAFTKTGTAATITWNSVPGASYRIEKSFDLETFIELTDGHPSDGQTTEFIDEDATEPQAFYRVLEEN